MSDAPKETAPAKSGVVVTNLGTEIAPFIYFDGVISSGLNSGAVQIELAANVVVPKGAGVEIQVVVTAHLRCSPTAAAALRDTINSLALLGATPATPTTN